MNAKQAIISDTTDHHQPVILDCTLRDGGYYNDWCFEPLLARQLIGALADAGVDLIEVGFKTPAGALGSDKFHGLYRFCVEGQLGYLNDYPDTSFAFMINTSEFLDDGKFSDLLLEQCLPPAATSLFDWVRIATHANTFNEAIFQAAWLKQRGYRVGLNLMGISLLQPAAIAKLARRIPDDLLDVFYFADSFGNLHPEDIRFYLYLLRSNYTGALGLHAHDNQGLAFANALMAIKENIEYIDSTVTGMGRGAGNLRTEQLLLALDQTAPHLKPSSLLPVIDRWLAPMQQDYGWGWDFTYMLGAVKNIHPSYCQTLRSNDHYTKEQVSSMLAGIGEADRAKYKHEALLNAIDNAVNLPRCQHVDKTPLAAYEPQPEVEVLIIAPGASRDIYAREIRAFIKQRQPLVIECNPENTEFSVISDRYMQCVLNRMRLEQMAASGNLIDAPLVTGVPALPESIARNNMYHFPCRVQPGKSTIAPDGLTLAAYVVGSFAAGLACLSDPDEIFLAGYDGYPMGVVSEQHDMQAFWDVVADDLGIKLTSLTETRYSLPTQSIYGYLQ